ncbi:MAG: ABC transporter ATP-binding protein [Actinomycetota bacterium]
MSDNNRPTVDGEVATVDEQPAIEPLSVAEILRPVRVPLALACLLRAISAVAMIFPFLAVARIGEDLLADGPIDSDAVWGSVRFGIIALVIAMVTMLGAAGITHVADVEFQLDIRRRLAERLGRVPLGWFDARNSGQVKKSLQDDVGAMHHLVGHALIDTVAAALTPLATIIVLLAIDWRLALFTFVPVIVGLYLYSTMMSGYGEKMQEYQDSLGRVNGAVVEFLAGIAVVKTFGEADEAHQRYTEETEGFADTFYEWISGMLKLSNLTEFILSPVTSVMWVLSGSVVFVANGWIEPTEALPFLLLGAGITAPIQALGFAAQEMQVGLAAAGRVGTLLATPTLEVSDSPRSPDGNDVRFDGVSFGYETGARDALTDIDLELRPGTVTALVGASGSGKTTIARLVPRFWDPQVGTVSIGGVDVRDIDPVELYQLVGFVFQDVQLLRASVADNIRLGRPDASLDEVVAAAKLARIHDRITELPDGYDTVVGDGAHLSGGEAQRVSIARLVLADTPILVLDEATAYADPESEAEIQEALSILAQGRTLLVIAHRLGTIVNADQICVVADARIVDRGTHETLIAGSADYQRLWAAHDSGVAGKVS